MSERSKKVSITVQTFSLILRGIVPPTKELTTTVEGDTEEEARSALKKLYIVPTEENNNE
jgi:hypothetical protein